MFFFRFFVFFFFPILLLLLLLLRLDTLNHNASIFFLYIKSKVACLFPLCCLKETNTTAKIYNPLSTRVTLYDARHRERAEAERERERERERFVCDVVSRSSLNRSDGLARFFSLRFDFVSRSHEGDTKRRRVCAFSASSDDEQKNLVFFLRSFRRRSRKIQIVLSSSVARSRNSFFTRCLTFPEKLFEKSSSRTSSLFLVFTGQTCRRRKKHHHQQKPCR